MGEQSVGISVVRNSFWLYDEENEFKRLPSALSSDIKFPVSGQQWLIEFDFVAHSLCLFLRLQTQWALAVKLEMKHKVIVPAFSLYDEDDEIEIV